MFENVEVFVELVSPDVVLPEYSNPSDAGMDVRSTADICVAPGQTVLVPTGIKVAIPEGYEIQVRPRSGMSLKTPMRISNSPGTIDAGYRDEICIIMTNTSLDESYQISNGDRIAQFVLQKVPHIAFKVVDSVAEIGENRGGGFGSTGKN